MAEHDLPTGTPEGHYDVRVLTKATNDFKKNNKIGDGGFGNVYQGFLDDGTPIAVKKSHDKSEKNAKQYQAEIKYFSMLQSPHIIELLGQAECDKHYYLVYEMMHVGDVLNNMKALDWSATVKILKVIASFLEMIHKKNLVHGDLKLQNILLAKDLTPKVGDFGTMEKEGEQQDIHTPGYRSPDYKFLNGPALKNEDVFAFGTIAFLLLEKKQIPFDSKKRHIGSTTDVKNWKEVLHNKLQNGCTKEKADILLGLAKKCCAHDASSRPSIGKVIEELQKI